jgi:uncharacterized YccA/Bax inhibitor family protein
MTKAELMKRYAVAKFAVTLARNGGDHQQAALVVQYTMMDMEASYKARARNVSEKEALEVLAMDVEDIEAIA